MSDFLLKVTEGTAHAMANELDIDVSTERQINAKTECLFIEYSVDDTIPGKRKRATLVRDIMSSDGFVTQLSDDRIIVTEWR